MTIPAADTLFAGSIPELYDTYLVPLIFEPYAVDLVSLGAAGRGHRRRRAGRRRALWTWRGRQQDAGARRHGREV